jgi:hypothetical protein
MARLEHYVAYCINFANANLTMFVFKVICLENLLQIMHNYFVHPPNKHSKFTKFIEIFETKGNKKNFNVKARWILMLSHVKRLMVEYIMLLVKMVLDNLTNKEAKMNYEHLCDLQFLLEFGCIFLC